MSKASRLGTVAAGAARRCAGQARHYPVVVPVHVAWRCLDPVPA